MLPVLCLGLTSGTHVCTRACTHTHSHAGLLLYLLALLYLEMVTPWAGERAAGCVSTAQLLSWKCISMRANRVWKCFHVEF